MAVIAAMSAAELVAAGTAAASAAVGAYSAVSSANAQRASEESAAKAAAYNAQIAGQQAQVANAQASANADASMRQSDLALGTVAASAAQNGTGLSGSAGALYQQDASSAEMTAMNIRYNGQLNAAALTSGGSLDTYQSQVDQQNASNATTAGYIGAASSALSSAGSYVNNQQRLNYYNTRNGGAVGMPS
jgi:hypothetical protein